MKKYLCLAAGLLVLSFSPVFAQPVSGLNSSPVPHPPSDKTGRYVWVESTNLLSKFDLEFPGGTPKELVKAIEKATDKNLNVIIPNEYANLKIPAVSVKSVTVAQLFAALESNSVHDERIVWRDFSGSTNGDSFSAPATWYDKRFGYGFKTVGIPDDNSVWYLYCDMPMNMQNQEKICRFYQLSPYLKAGYKLDDIMTDIQTGWKMLGIADRPQLSYHKETKILIAVGEADKVVLIGDVLERLSKIRTNEKPSDNHAE